MLRLIQLCIGLALAALALGGAPARAAASLTVEGTQFVLTTDAGKRLMSPALVGAVLDMDDPDGVPVTVRIDRVIAAADRPATLLHYLSVKRPDGSFAPMCPPDAYGRAAAFPIAGRWDAQGHYVRDPAKWFLSCTLGSQAKCILWGYDPWTPGAARRGPEPVVSGVPKPRPRRL